MYLLSNYWLIDRVLDAVDETGLCEKYSKEIDAMVESQSTKSIEINVMLKIKLKLNIFLYWFINYFQVDGLSKEQRKSIHNFLKFKYGTKVSTNTKKDDQDKQFIVIRLSTLVKNG